ncbi:MAG TPA: sulfocyanin-like copper-binding protein [Gemmatimonadales bacterium]|nr:sulfocyanin-like copper-binding protein [Gemmatimonadales bacterium]
MIHLPALFVVLALYPPRRAPLPDSLPSWVTMDSAARVVTLALEAEPGGPDGIATLNGHHHGDIQLVVPLNWTVRWTWINRDSVQSHSLVVMAEREKLPAEGGRPAMDNAMTRAVTAGLKVGQKDVTTFVADQAGWYWLLCGVPTHALRGEWIGLKVDRQATTPAVVVK